MAGNNEKKVAKAVYVIREFGDNKTSWIKVGVAFVNRDTMRGPALRGVSAATERN